MRHVVLWDSSGAPKERLADMETLIADAELGQLAEDSHL